MRQKRGRKWWKWAAAILLILVVIDIAAANIMVNIALIPKYMEKTEAFEDITEDSLAALVQTSDIQQNEEAAWRETNQWLEGAETRKLVLTSEDGYDLIAREFLQEEESHKWVVLLHGYTGWKEEMYPIGCEYAKRGYRVLAPDMRCQGESQGNFIGMGWTEKGDNRLWLEYVISQDPEAEIVLHGQSMGASCALMMAGDDLPENVKAVVSDCAYTDAYSMFRKQMKDWFHLPAFPLLDSANWMVRLRAGYSLKEASALNQVKKSSLPMLFIHGVQDEMIPVEMAQELYDGAKGKKELLLIEGAGHAQAPVKNPEEYYGTVFSFLESCGVS